MVLARRDVLRDMMIPTGKGFSVVVKCRRFDESTRHPQVEAAMRRELAIEFSRVTEAAALAGYKWLGRGDKNVADGAAVAAMRLVLNQVEIDGEIVIGEGEIDEAPMLYIGEKVGCGGDAVDIAVDPIDGTRMTAMGQAKANGCDTFPTAKEAVQGVDAVVEVGAGHVFGLLVVGCGEAKRDVRHPSERWDPF